ncbi:CDP-glycerol:poly(glycerophosphate) glycerophosphotransferase [Shewanella pealeana ATCC 700345]|uniref:CDP-glycerol:poly(Glycerophosphate) glycerophosphotransferase n=2 Tax=Shewanella pealeana TaxID=70864 RepID=A8H2E6_SHEPA|nr:CDP-glycerol:poly(glycerophosphate) glycerophosphotransferase [Shewanella pealeana ATCC 700345]
MTLMIRKYLKSISWLRILVIKCRRVSYYFRVKFLIRLAKLYQEREIKRIQNNTIEGKKINVVFLVLYRSIWKVDLVFKEMMKDERYNPCIVVIPRTNTVDPLSEAKETYEYFKSKGYKTKLAYQDGKWQDLELVNKIDLVFFSIPYKNTEDKYLINSLYRKVCCYVPYFEQIDKDYDVHFNGLTENLCWKIFQINKIHKDIAAKFSYNKGMNIDVVGYTATEPLYNDSIVESNPWKCKNLKKIIIAPHHSIDKNTDLSNATFLETYKTLQLLPKLYENYACFAFKPHPLLKEKLYEHPEWGIERTNKYWKFWEEQHNTQIENAGYIDLFKSSDAMIHDCSSFIIEYLYVNKPCLYLNPNVRNQLNAYGVIGFDAITKSYCNNDIIDFVEKVISGVADAPQYEQNVSLIPQASPSKSVMRILNSELFKIKDNEI